MRRVNRACRRRPAVSTLLAVCLTCFLLPAASHRAVATTYVVRPDGTGDFPKIANAILAATDGDVIELTNGTFTGDGNRDLDYQGKAIAIRSQAGDPDSCVIDCEGSPTNEHRAFRFRSAEDAQSVLSGITITNGYSITTGGGIECVGDASPRITHCVFAENVAEEGGGMDCRGGAAPTLEACLFRDNEAVFGGGLSCYYSASPTLIACTFRGNSADYGGGLGLNEGSSPIVTDCLFAENDCMPSGYGGGMCSFWYTAPQVTGCEFRDNEAGEGGALYT